MKTETLLRGTIVAVTLTLFCVSVYYSKEHIQFDEVKTKRVLGSDTLVSKNYVDSLESELFNAKTINGRYELTFDHLKEVNPKVGKETEEWMNHETE